MSPRRFGTALATWAALWGCSGEEARLDNSGGGSVSPPFAGISTDLPTGHTGISAEGLVGSWNFTASGSARALPDLSGNGHSGAFTDWESVSAPFGVGARFHDPERRIHLTEDPAFDLDGPITVAAWLRVDEGGRHQHVVACDDKWALWITPDDRYRMGDTRGGGFSTGPGTVTKGAWTSVVAVLDGTAGTAISPETARIYVNGTSLSAERHMRSEEAQQRTVWEPGELYDSDACYIGFESHQGNDAHQNMPFYGALDELLIFRRPWTEEEVVAFSTPPPA